MAIIQNSKIKIRSGLQQNLPILSQGELGWAIDTQRLFIGNGSVSEGAPYTGNTEIITVANTSQLINVVPVSGTFPTGVQDGTNKVFTFPYQPITNSLIVWCNFPLIPNVGYRATITTTTTVTFTIAPLPTDKLFWQAWIYQPA